MTSISNVAWALQPGGRKRETRPAKLIDGLIQLAVVDKSPRYFFHGKATSAERNRNSGRWFPKMPQEANHAACVLSPVYQLASGSAVVWMDFYDDWSIAPDINPWYRFLAGRTYRTVSGDVGSQALITCNSTYMAAKLGLSSKQVLPNGVDGHLASLPSRGDDRTRLVILGHLFAGRTDKTLLREALMEWNFDEIVVGAPGNDRGVLSVIEEARAAGRSLRVENWISHEELALIAGSRTAALIPHVTSDYTISQDLMKVYQFIALGIKVICPRLLWPSKLSDEFAYLYGIGSDRQALSDWNDSFCISSEQRTAFVELNSWTSRAAALRKLLLEHQDGA